MEKRKFAYQAEYEQGYDDGCAGKNPDECPFDWGTDARTSWMLGYAAANLRKVGPK